MNSNSYCTRAPTLILDDSPWEPEKVGNNSLIVEALEK
jgi:hypothetical protein